VIDSIMLSILQANHRKSLRIILLATNDFVTPLESHSYKKIGGTPLPTKSVETPADMSPIRKSFRSNHLTRFPAGPPHVSLLESEGCQKWGWGRGVRQNVLTRIGRSGSDKYRQALQTYLISGARPAALRIPTLPDTMILAGICGSFALPPRTDGSHS
jgi:hypothetical protein